MGGATRSGCNKLTTADNEILKDCFEACTDDDGKDICSHCSAYKVLKKNITKRLQHIAICKAFSAKCTGEDSVSVSLNSFKDRAIMACEGYAGNSKSLNAASK